MVVTRPELRRGVRRRKPDVRYERRERRMENGVGAYEKLIERTLSRNVLDRPAGKD